MMDSQHKISITELTKDELAFWLNERGIKTYRAVQIFKWVYLKQADTFEEMTDIGLEIRKLVSQHFAIDRLGKKRIEIK